MGVRRFDLPRRTRMGVIPSLCWGACVMAFFLIPLLRVMDPTIAPLGGGLIDLLLLLTLPVAWHFGIARRRRQLLCRAMIVYAEQHYFLLERLGDQAGQGDGNAAARARWLAEIERFIDRFTACMSKPGDIKIINDCRADLIDAIDQRVAHSIDA